MAIRTERQRDTAKDLSEELWTLGDKLHDLRDWAGGARLPRLPLQKLIQEADRAYEFYWAESQKHET